MPLNTDLWNIETPVARTEPVYLEKELDRWTALLEDPVGLATNPYQYGPLTVEGFMYARQHNDLKKHHSWPQDPEDIASLMVICNMNASYEAKYVALELTSHISFDSNLASAKIFQIHIALLKKLDITPSKDVLLDFLDDFDWGQGYSEDYLYAFDAMKMYLPSMQDQDAFLEKWLPTLKSSRNAYGVENSLGAATAASFPDVGSDVIANWCKNNDDQVGLGYLVWQDRLSFTAWLCEVAEPTTAAIVRSWDSNSQVAIKQRREEQLATLKLLSQKLPSERLHREGRVFSENFPELLGMLMERTEHGVITDNNLRWAFGLLEAQVLPLDNPLVNNWVTRAHDEHEQIISNFAVGKLKFSDDGHGSLHEKMHYICGPISAILGEKARDVLARDIVLRADSDTVGTYLANMPERSWLKGANVVPLIHARAQMGLKRANNMMVAFYPFMPVHDQREIAQHLLEGASNGSINVGNAANTMFSVDPENFMHGISSKHKELALMMHLVTKTDPEVLFSTMKSLDVDKGDPLYTSMIREWVSNNIGHDTLNISVPNDLGENMVGL